MAQWLEPDFRVVFHRRAAIGALLPQLAQELHAVLHNSRVAPPFFLVAHSFGALVARQFAVRYPGITAGIVFVDGLPVDTQIPAQRIRRAVIAARVAQLAATFGLAVPLFPVVARHNQAASWALAELRKLPVLHQQRILAEWGTPVFHAGLAAALETLTANLRIARKLQIPATVPTISLHSDYPDPNGRRVEHSGHWIQIDQPECVAHAVRELAAASMA